MKAALSRRGFPLLGRLTSDTSDDPAVALLDAWATVADVLTFYQERIANEGYIRTATEHRSLVELARLVGYVPRPGVAASVYLAYTLEKDLSLRLDKDTAGSPRKEPTVTIPLGARVQTIPGPGELPQSFETAEALEARASWNRLKPGLTRPQRITPENAETLETLYFDGIATGLKTNDVLLFVFRNPAKEFYRRIAVVHDPDADKKRTKVTMQPVSELRAVAKAVDPFIPNPPEKGKQETQTEKTRREILETLKQEMVANAPPGERLARISKKINTLEGIVKRSRAGEMRDWLTKVVATLNATLKKGRGETEGGKEDGISQTPTRDTQYAERPLSDLVYDVLAKIPWPKDTALSERLPTMSVEDNNLVTVYAFRLKASPFGHNAPKRSKAPYDMDPKDWPVKEMQNVLYLDGSHDKIVPNSWVIFEYGPHGDIWPTTVDTVDTGISRAEYGITGKTTRLALSSSTAKGKSWFQKGDSFDVIRQTVVYAQSEELPLVGEPIVAPIGGGKNKRIELDGYVEGLKPNRWLIVAGEEEDTSRTPAEIGLNEERKKELQSEVKIQGVRRSELVQLDDVQHGWPTLPETEESKNKLAPVPGGAVHTTLVLANDLQYRYKRETVEIYGNVVRATHGETRKEILGSGDAGKALQRFFLSQKPLTHTAASTPSGSTSSLTVYVNDVRWYEAERLTDLGRSDRAFVVQTDDEQKTAIIFGDGTNGARLPTGTENIKAEYRTGIGISGNVEAERIRLLMTRPLGVKEVDNPVRASGGADPERTELVRENASLGVMVFDRVVSVQDYEDFARSFAGIGKARAELLRHGRQQFIHLTIAGIDDVPIDEESDLYKHLNDALRQCGDPHHQFSVASRELLVLILSVNIVVLPDYQWDSVKEKVRARLLSQFSFSKRTLGQDVFLSEVITAMQQVPGVRYVDVDVFDWLAQMGDEGQLPRPLTFSEMDHKAQKKIIEAKAQIGGRPGGSITVSPAGVRSGKVRPAQLAYIPSAVPSAIVLTQRLT